MHFLAQLTRFGGVGLTAMMIHWGIVLLLVPLGCLPLVANIFAFLIAFQFSYWGHRSWTFKVDSLVNHNITQRRFLVVAIGGFLLNQSLFWALLKFSNLSYQLALLLVLLIVAVNSFVLSKFWESK